ncbi:MAG: hypothetical protein JNK17_03160 [Hydrogenophaga sp.]|uniref:DUF6776 family protein n=1 Tax=Hydrogenophaga sp. TaxID=1904254 RepID=UPI001A48C031|nr:hypothetical protein [Hydrogenophaga sp.]
MRLRLLRRRLTVSAPRVSIRSATPWPLRWLMAAVVLGFSGALALWAFEFGKDIAGLDRNAKVELEHLRAEVSQLREDLGKAQSIANTSDSLLTAEKAAQEQLVLQIRQLQADNQNLRTDLGFFERLIPGTGSDALSIRGLQIEKVGASQLRWQVLMIQAEKNAPEFKGQLDISFAGTVDGKPWAAQQAAAPENVTIRGYLRQEGLVDVPPQAVVKTVTAKILQGGAVKVLHTIKL